MRDMTREDFWKNHKNNSLWDEVVRALLEKENIQYHTLNRFPMGGNIVYDIDNQLVLKLFSPYDSREFFIETNVLEETDWSRVHIEVPRIIQKGIFKGWHFFIMTRVRGELLIDVWNLLSKDERIGIAVDLGKLIQQMHALDINVYKELNQDFDQWIIKQKNQVEQHHNGTGLSSHLVREVKEYVASFEPSSEKVLVTSEYTPFNLIVNRVQNRWTLTGLIDFADCFIGEPNYDLLGPILFNFYKEPELTRAFLNSYGLELTDQVQVRLMQLLLLHQFSNLPNYMDGVIDMNDVKSLESLSKLFFAK